MTKYVGTLKERAAAAWQARIAEQEEEKRRQRERRISEQKNDLRNKLVALQIASPDDDDLIVQAIEGDKDSERIYYVEDGFRFYVERAGQYSTILQVIRYCERCRKWTIRPQNITGLDDLGAIYERGDEWHDCDAQAAEEVARAAEY